MTWIVLDIKEQSGNKMPIIKRLQRHPLLVLSFLCYVAATDIVYFDTDLSLQNISYALWVIAIALAYIGLPTSKKPGKLKGFWQKLPKSELLIFIGIVSLAVFTALLFINIYPFTSIGDELRDTGLNAAQIARHEKVNIFHYGAYHSFGLTIPTFLSFFYNFGFLKETALFMRLPAAIVSILDVILLYFVARKFLSKEVAIWASLILISLPLHLFYGRTEVVVILSSLSTTAVLYALGNFLEARSIRNYGILGLLLGLMLGFHASAKTIALLALVIVFAISLYYYFKKVERSTLVTGFALMLILILISFGPRILFSPPDVFLQTSKIGIVAGDNSEDNNQPAASTPLFFKPFENYPKSLLVYIAERTTSHYHDKKPILSFGLGVLFIIGLVVIFMPGTSGRVTGWLRLLAIFALAIPFTNSAVTETLNMDHRLTPLLPVASLLIAYALTEIFHRVKNASPLGYKFLKPGLSLILVIALGFSVFGFFDKEPASYSMYRVDDSKIYQDYMLTYAIKTTKEDTILQNSKKICFNVSSANTEFFNYLHIQQQYRYYLPDKEVHIQEVAEGVEDDAIYISQDCVDSPADLDWQEIGYCTSYEKYICPPDKSSFKVFIEKAVSLNSHFMI